MQEMRIPEKSYSSILSGLVMDNIITYIVSICNSAVSYTFLHVMFCDILACPSILCILYGLCTFLTNVSLSCSTKRGLEQGTTPYLYILYLGCHTISYM